MNAVSEILAVDGIDAVTVGPVDLAASMGFHGDRTVEVVDLAVQKVLTAAQKRSKPILLAASNPKQMEWAWSMGATMTMVPFSSWLVQNGQSFLRETKG